MPTYDIEFDFATAGRGGLIKGRSGILNVTTKIPIQIDRDRDELQQLCQYFVYGEKPKWKTFMFRIKNITELKTKTDESTV